MQWPSEKIFDVLNSLAEASISTAGQKLRLGQMDPDPFATLVSLGVQDGAVLDLIPDESAQIPIRIVVRLTLS